jgi:DNA modification methylase
LIKKPNKKEKEIYNTHITVKPIELMKKLIEIFSKPQHTILDPFMGSGSTGVAA